MNDQPAPAVPVYDRAAWETYRRDARCECTAPDPADCARQHLPGPWMCPCHYLSVVPTAAELAAAKAERGERPDLTVDTDAVDPEPADQAFCRHRQEVSAAAQAGIATPGCDCGHPLDEHVGLTADDRCAKCHCTAYRSAPAAPLASGLSLVTGHCPACGWQSLFLGDGGYVTCARLECPVPDAASTLLEQRDAVEGAAKPGENPAAYRIRAELVCCDIYGRVNDRHETTFEQAHIDDGSTHTICYWGEAAARIAEAYDTGIDTTAPGDPHHTPAPAGLRQRVTDALNRLLRAKGYDPQDPDVDHAQFDRETAEVVDAIMPVVQPAPLQRPDLRQQYADALRTTPSTGNTHKPGQERFDHHPRPGEGGHNYTYTCALCRSDVDALADAVMAVRDTELEQARTEAARSGEALYLAQGALIAARDLLTELQQARRTETLRTRAERAEAARALDGTQQPTAPKPRRPIQGSGYTPAQLLGADEDDEPFESCVCPPTQAGLAPCTRCPGTTPEADRA